MVSLRLRPVFLRTGRLSHLVSLLLLQFVHRPLQSLLQQVHQPHRVSRPSLKLLPEKQKFRERQRERERDRERQRERERERERQRERRRRWNQSSLHPKTELLQQVLMLDVLSTVIIMTTND